VTGPGSIVGGAFVPGNVASPNVYQGVVSGNSVTFFGVPAMPPTTTGTRVYRITNVRVNATSLAAAAASAATAVTGSIVITGATSLPITNSAPIVGYVSNGLTTSASSATGLNQCSSATKSAINVLTYSENFGTAFKTRVNAASNNAYAGQINNPTQNVPGGIYNSESNFVFPVSSSQVAGLADFGTRLKATFNGIPSGARIFVSTANVNNAAFPFGAPAVIGGNAANANSPGTYIGYAQLVSTGSTESVNDGNAGVTGFFPQIASSDNGPNNGNVPIAEVSIANGTGAAVWEVVNTNPNTMESLNFAVYVTYSANVAQNSPLPGTSTVNMSYAPTPPAFTTTAGVAASSSLPIPRFADTSSAKSIFTISICRTILLYPYVTAVSGFDTGIAIANTSTDPFTVGNNVTGAQSGTCKLNYYNAPASDGVAGTNPAAYTTPTIQSGATWASSAGVLVPGFSGYVFAVCNFQYAHGFAAVGDTGFRNLMSTYLAIIIPDPGTGSRNASPACQGISGCSTTGEQDAH
jgi:hypothetical protein